MVARIRATLVCAALVAAFGALSAAHAQEVLVPDAATTAAIEQWHAAALMHVDPAFHATLAAMYADVAVDPAMANAAAGAKLRAEAAATADLDKTAKVLIENYSGQVAAAAVAEVPSFSETNDT